MHTHVHTHAHAHTHTHAHVHTHTHTHRHACTHTHTNTLIEYTLAQYLKYVKPLCLTQFSIRNFLTDDAHSISILHTTNRFIIYTEYQ